MAGKSGSEKRQRYIKRTTGFNEEEYRALLVRLEQTGLPFATLSRCAVLDMPLPRARPVPTVHHEAVARLLGELGIAATELKKLNGHLGKIGSNLNQLARYAHMGRLQENSIDLALRELGTMKDGCLQTYRQFPELRAACLKALGMEP